MDLTEKECRSALLTLAYATTSLTDEDGADGLNHTQAAIAEAAARVAVRQVLMQTRGPEPAAPALEIHRRLRSVGPAEPSVPASLPDTIA